MAKYNWSALCRQKTEGWSSPTFRIGFTVEADNEGDAEWKGRTMTHHARPDVEFQKIEITEIVDLVEQTMRDWKEADALFDRREYTVEEIAEGIQCSDEEAKELYDRVQAWWQEEMDNEKDVPEDSEVDQDTV